MADAIGQIAMNAASTPLFEHRPAGTLDLFAMWLESSAKALPGNQARQVEMWLYSADDEQSFENQLCDALIEILECLHSLVQQVAADDSPEGERLNKWFDGVNELIRPLQPKCQSWCDAYAQLCDQNRPLFSAVLCACLERIADIHPPDPDVQPAIDQLMARFRKPFDDLPVPPAEDTPVSASAYVQKDADPELHSRLQPLLAEFLCGSESIEEALMREWDGGNDASDASSQDALIIAVENLSHVLNQYETGWPIQYSHIREPVESLEQLLSSRSIQGATSANLRNLIAALQSDTPPPAARKLRHIAPQSTAAKTDAGITENHSLAPFVQWLQKQPAAFAQPLLQRFQAQLTRPSSDAALSRFLLTVLIDINESLTETTGFRDAFRQLREQIHSYLRGRDFRILGDELVGKPVPEVRRYISVFRAYPSESYPSNHVISVRQPGYALRNRDGEVSVVRPAQVCVSR